MSSLQGMEGIGLLEAAPDAIVVVDASGAIVLLNAQAERLFGYRRADLIGQPIEVLVPEAVRAGHPARRASYTADPHPRPMGAGLELAARRADGSEFPSEISLSAVSTPDGLLVAAAVRDATERRRSEARFRGLLEAAPDAMVCVDADGVIRLVNTQAERLFGYDRAELVGQPVDLLVPDAARGSHPGHRAGYVADPVPRPMGAGRQLSARRKDGSEFPAEISLGALESEEGLLVSAAIRDVTERLELEAERERLRAAAEQERVERQMQQSQRLESLGQLAGGVAHDFNNLLGAILNYAAFVEEELEAAANGDTDRPWDVAASDIGQIKRAAERAAELTHQLLAFARREVVRPQAIDINEAVRSVQDLLTHSLGEHVELTVQLGGGLPRILADAGQLEQVLVNLAVNARDAMPEGGRLEIATSAVVVDDASARQHDGIQPGPYVRLRVSDTGAGMSKEVADRAFEPFFTTKPKGEGTGLGLATVYGIVTQAGGSARLYSEAGIGTTFTALLPVTDEVPMGSMAEAAPPPQARAAEVVLVVEDEDLVRDVAVRVLRRAGYEVVAAPDGPTAIRLADELDEPIAVLLCDVVMPKMLGRDVAERVQARRPEVSVVFMSGYAEPVLGARGTLDPGVRLVEKPFTEGELLAAVRAALDADG